MREIANSKKIDAQLHDRDAPNRCVYDQDVTRVCRCFGGDLSTLVARRGGQSEPDPLPFE